MNVKCYSAYRHSPASVQVRCEREAGHEGLCQSEEFSWAPPHKPSASDKKRRGGIRISFETLARLLHLRVGLTIISVSVEANTETIQLILDGESMPELLRKQAVFNISLSELMDVDH